MKSIEIEIINMGSILEMVIDVSNGSIKVNDEFKKIDVSLIEELIRIIRTWDNEYNNDSLIDSESFMIKISDNNKVDIIKGKGKYPKNYNTFKRLLGDIYG